MADNLKYFSIKLTDEGYVAELNAAVLSGVPYLPNIELHDSSEVRLITRASELVREIICPTDLVVRKMAQQMVQQKLIP